VDFIAKKQENILVFTTKEKIVAMLLNSNFLAQL